MSEKPLKKAYTIWGKYYRCEITETKDAGANGNVYCGFYIRLIKLDTATVISTAIMPEGTSLEAAKRWSRSTISEKDTTHEIKTRRHSWEEDLETWEGEAGEYGG